MNRLHLTGEELENIGAQDGNNVDYHSFKADQALRKYLYHLAIMNHIINKQSTSAIGLKPAINTYISDSSVIISYTDYNADGTPKREADRAFYDNKIEPTLITRIGYGRPEVLKKVNVEGHNYYYRVSNHDSIKHDKESKYTVDNAF